ncbi:hypothetical protein BDZ89DRAFT_1124400 [Hymenopellis radicata]|nr:hypothetical protein BDZ89DRAFT_1124400 [Hymenopellis radicata]
MQLQKPFATLVVFIGAIASVSAGPAMEENARRDMKSSLERKENCYCFNSDDSTVHCGRSADFGVSGYCPGGQNRVCCDDCFVKRIFVVNFSKKDGVKGRTMQYSIQSLVNIHEQWRNARIYHSYEREPRRDSRKSRVGSRGLYSFFDMRTIDGSEVPSLQYLPSCPAYTSSMTRRKIVGLLKSAIHVASMELRVAVEASDWPRWEREARTYAQAVVQSYAPQVFWAVEEEKISLEEGFELLGKEQRRWMGYVSQDTYAKFKARVDSARSKPSPSPSAPVKPSPSEAAKPATSSGSSRLASASDEELCASRTRAMCSSPAPSPLRKEVDAVETIPTTSAPLPSSRPALVPPVHPPSSAPPRVVQTTAPKLTEDARRPSIPSAKSSTASRPAETTLQQRRESSATTVARAHSTPRPHSPASDIATVGTRRGRSRRRRRRRRRSQDPNASTSGSSQPKFAHPSPHSTSALPKASYAKIAASAAQSLGLSIRDYVIVLVPVK